MNDKMREDFNEWFRMFPRMTERDEVVTWEAWQAAIVAASQQAPVAGIPPNHWDEWAMHRSRKIVQEMEDVSHPRAQLVARIHCLLIDAMEFAAMPVLAPNKENL
jgi:hypothetical protein